MRPQLLNRVRVSTAFASIALVLVGVSCTSFDDRAGSSGGSEGPTVTAEGTWSGSWAMTSGVPDSGTVTFEISQESDGTLFGTSRWTGSHCWTVPGIALAQPPPADELAEDMIFSGSIIGNLIPSANVVEIPQDPLGTVPRRAAYRAAARLEIVDDRMIGTFEVTLPATSALSLGVNTSRCNDLIHRLGNVGVLELTRQ